MNSVLQGADWLARWVSGKTAVLATGGWEFQGGGRGVVGQWILRGPMSILSCTALRWCRMRQIGRAHV